MRDHVVVYRRQAARDHLALRLARHLPVLLILAAACGPADRTGSDGSTLASGPVYVRQHVPAGDPQTATPFLVIGEDDGPDAFGRISGVAVIPDVGVFVTDAQEANVRGYSFDGERLFTFGRRGGGPGEFRDLRGIIVKPDGNLWLYDYRERRYTEITTAGELVATYQSKVPAFGRRWHGQFGADGRFYDVATVSEGTESRSVYVAHEIRDGTLIPVDTFPLPSTTGNAYFVQSTVGILNIPIPYAAQPFWAFDGEQIWFGDGEQTSVWRRILRGDTSLVLEFGDRRQPVTNDDRRLARDDLESVLKDVGGLSLVDLTRIPEQHPAHGRLLTDGHGNLWISRPVVPSLDGTNEQATFDVFDRDGRYSRSVMLRLNQARPIAMSTEFIAGVSMHDDATPRVVLYRLQ